VVVLFTVVDCGRPPGIEGVEGEGIGRGSSGENRGMASRSRRASPNQSTLYGDTKTYECKEGYSLNPNATSELVPENHTMIQMSECSANGTWLPQPTDCLSKLTLEYQLMVPGYPSQLTE